MTRAPLLIVRIASLPFQSLDALRGEGASAAADALLDAIAERERDAEALGQELYQAAGASVPPELAGARGALLGVRRAIHQGRSVEESDRERAAPLLSPETNERIRRHRERARRVEASRRDFSRAFSAAEGSGRAAIADAIANPLVRIGLRLASRSLLSRAEGLAVVPRWGQRERHAAAKALAYLGRFATKTSPNGVFCATSLGAVHDGPADLRGENRIARLDFALHVGEARKVAACLAASAEFAPAIHPRVNPTLRREGDAWTLWQPASPRRETDDEVLLRIGDHPVMRMFLDAATGEASAAQVIESVAARVGQDVGPFYAKLVERGVLIGEVEIPWSERRPLRALAARCPGAEASVEVEALEAEVDALAGASFETIPAGIDALTGRLRHLPRVRPIAEDDAIRCDAATEMKARLPRRLLADLERLLPWYARFYGAIYPEPLTRETFAARFLKRYPPDTPIPVLDFYHDLFVPVPAGPLAAFTSAASGSSSSPLRAAAGRAFERAREFFVRRARDAAASGLEEVALTEADWEEITGSAAEPRFACAALVQVAAPSASEVEAPSARVCLNALFPGAGISVARLAHLHRPDSEGVENGIVRFLHDGWSRRSRPDAALAEVTFMHGGRTANAGLRPCLFPLEIELPGERVSDGAEAIPLADLTAAWDSAGGRFTLRSVSRGLEIDPVISSGINPEGFVSFLTMVGSQGIQPLGLLPGFDSPDVRRWPRFRLGNAILFRRRWVFAKQELPTKATAEEEHFLEMQRRRREEGLPTHVFVHTDLEPKPFYVNLGSPAFVDLLRRSLAAGAERVHMTEMLPGPDDLWVRDSRGRYASEFLVHLDNLDDARGAVGRP